MLEERLLATRKALMASDPSSIPFASILAAEPDTSRFEWAEYYRAVLRALHDPFVDGKVARIRTGNCAKRRKPRSSSASLSRSL